ncbi:PDZK1-interacting protein 1 isoform X2 [Physeter macrocephalus]|uniref:PDZK1-interacting protein 1 n=1 Tax=Physeter macrocephalus TaxID=9755 RepID=A0A9W2WL98_PHYMC|nr:PDZK1-interacting protein 1 isoform X2 [Physeter catodon]
MDAVKTPGQECSALPQGLLLHHVQGLQRGNGQTLLLCSRTPRPEGKANMEGVMAVEPVNMVMTLGNKADGILVGTDGKYSSMEASFRPSEHENAYENSLEEEGKVRSTPM